VMVTALRTAIWRDGIKVGTGGYELLLLANAVAIVDLGPGRWSLDAALGRERRGAGLAAAAFGAALAGSAVAIAAGKRYSEARGEDLSASERGDQAEAKATTA
jgi:putative oxidoreductase